MPSYYIPKEEFRIVKYDEILPYVENAPDLEYSIFIQIGYITGMRLSEIINLKASDFYINEKERELTISHKALKFGKVGYATFSFDDPFVMNIINYVRGFNPEDYIFHRRSKSSYQKMLLKLNRQLHKNNYQKYITFHYLRHSRITFLARILKAFPEELKAWTGHRSMAFEDYYMPRKVERFKGQFQ